MVIACVCALISGVAAANLATGSFQIGTVGETASIPIVLDSAAGGISGYQITVSLSNPSVATITAVTFPDWAALKSASALPSGQVVLKSADLSQQVPEGATGVLLATLTVKGTAIGSTGIVVTPDPTLGVQNRDGNLYAVSTSPGTLTVGGAPPVIVPTPLPTSMPPTSVPTIVVPTVIPTAGRADADPDGDHPHTDNDGCIADADPDIGRFDHFPNLVAGLPCCACRDIRTRDRISWKLDWYRHSDGDRTWCPADVRRREAVRDRQSRVVHRDEVRLWRDRGRYERAESGDGARGNAQAR